LDDRRPSSRARTQTSSRLLERRGSAQQEPLPVGAAGSAELAVLRCELDALGDGLETQRLRETDDGERERVLPVVGDTGDEALVDLDDVDRKFTLLLPNCTPAHAHSLAERLQTVIPHGQSVSMGIAHGDGHQSADTLLAFAGSALYSCKRNRHGARAHRLSSSQTSPPLARQRVEPDWLKPSA
jgi:hypothetical protein